MILLEVPFTEKEVAKSLGARWNPMEKKWYVPDELEDRLSAFSKWLPLQTVTQSALSSDAIPANERAKGISLSQLMMQVQGAMRQAFPGAVWVKAELANLNERRGHLYLELSETAESGQPIANCRAMIWQSQVKRLLERFALETGSALKAGQKVLLLAEANFHEKFGFSLVIQDLDPSFTLGELEANLNKIRQQLIADKLYDLNKNQPFPKDFFRVAVIAPPNAAGLGDFRADADQLQAANLCEFKYIYSAFQGDRVEAEMLAAFEAFNGLHNAKAFDALIIIRGGGAKLDLNPLNVYSLAKQIAQISVPVLTGIGHERDTTILDEVACMRFDTPSKVIAGIRQSIFSRAQKAHQHWLMIERASRLYVQQQKQSLINFENRVQRQSLAITEKLKQNLAPLHYQIQRQSFSLLEAEKHQLHQLHQNLNYQVSAALNLQKLFLNQFNQTLKDKPFSYLTQAKMQNKQWIGFILSSGPKTQLNRGFAIVKNRQGDPIKTAELARQQSQIHITFRDGTLQAIPIDK